MDSGLGLSAPTLVGIDTSFVAELPGTPISWGGVRNMVNLGPQIWLESSLSDAELHVESESVVRFHLRSLVSKLERIQIFEFRYSKI